MKASTLQQHHTGPSLTYGTLRRENGIFQKTGGVSQNNRDEGFRSAFCDYATGSVYLSRFADGRPAPVHLLDGLPDELVLQRNPEGRITTIKSSVVAGFLRAGRFYTREQAAQSVVGC